MAQGWLLSVLLAWERTSCTVPPGSQETQLWSRNNERGWKSQDALAACPGDGDFGQSLGF